MMDGKKPKAGSGSLEDRIRRERKFSLTEAVAREAAGTVSGGSPVARARQVLLEIEHLLESRLADPDGSLIRTILARLEHDLPLLGRHFDHPAGALLEFLEATLGSPHLLDALVRDADARWGRENRERPHFEVEGRPPHPEDPYVRDQVRASLENLRTALAESPPT